MRLDLCSLALVCALVGCERSAPPPIVLADASTGVLPIGPGGCFMLEYDLRARTSSPVDTAPMAASVVARRTVRLENMLRIAPSPATGRTPQFYRLNSIDSTRFNIQGRWTRITADSAEFSMMHVPGTFAVHRADDAWTGVLHDPRDVTPTRDFRRVTLRPISCEVPARG